MRYKKLWMAFFAVILVSFAVLGYYGGEIYRQAPPVPERITTVEGTVIWRGQDIKEGQNVWQSIGGQQLGSIWGHGAYVAPDWSADWLHRECLWRLDAWSQQEHGKPFGKLDATAQATLNARLKSEVRTNTFDADTSEITITTDRARAVEAIGRYYAAIFGDAQEFPDDVKHVADGGMSSAELRSAYAIPANTVRDADRQDKLNAFFFYLI